MSHPRLASLSPSPPPPTFLLSAVTPTTPLLTPASSNLAVQRLGFPIPDGSLEASINTQRLRLLSDAPGAQKTLIWHSQQADHLFLLQISVFLGTFFSAGESMGQRMRRPGTRPGVSVLVEVRGLRQPSGSPLPRLWRPAGDANLSTAQGCTGLTVSHYLPHSLGLGLNTAASTESEQQGLQMT